jgi:hypothetical protein
MPIYLPPGYKAIETMTSRRHRNSCLGLRSAWRLAIFLLCVFVSGCGRDAATISSTKSISPDGLWVAEAHTDQYGGPGTAGIISTVSLNRVTGRQDKIEVLQLSHNVTTSIDLKLNWLTSSHLEITYNQASSVDFQAIRAAGMDITVRNLSSTSDTPVR